MISDKASIHPSAKIGKNCTINDFVSIGADCTIGDNCTIMSYSHIHRSSILKDNVFIGLHCQIGSDGYGYAQNREGQSFFTPQIGNVILEDGVKVLDYCCIDRSAFKSTVLGKNTVLGGHSHIAHNLVFGEDCIIEQGFTVAGSTRFGNRIKLGARTNCVGHIDICDDFECEPMVLINNNVTTAGKYAGTLLLPSEEWQQVKKSLLDLHTWNLEGI